MSRPDCATPLVLSPIPSWPFAPAQPPASLALPGQVLFRSLHRLLMDTAAHEYLFCQVCA